MKQQLLYSSLALLIFGTIGRIYANQYTHVTPDGVLHDTIMLPISTFILLLGVATLLVAGLVYGVGVGRRS